MCSQELQNVSRVCRPFYEKEFTKQKLERKLLQKMTALVLDF
jgi:hypothetical protein